MAAANITLRMRWYKTTNNRQRSETYFKINLITENSINELNKNIRRVYYIKVHKNVDKKWLDC